MKNQTLLAILFCSTIHLNAQTFEGPKNPGSFSTINIPGYSQTWTNVGNAAISDHNYSTFGNINGFGNYTNYLVATNFGFDIPKSSTITGIKVEVECSDPNSRTSDYSVRLVSKGALIGSDRATGAHYPVTDNYMVYGGSADLWGYAWFYKLIDDPDFGVAIAAKRSIPDLATTAGQVNSIRITIYYTPLATLPVSLTSFTATKQATTVHVNWKTSAESNMDHYELERSSNGANFNSVISIPSLNSSTANYNYTDNHPLPGISYYRLNMKELTGDQKYSPVVAVSFARNKNTTFLYPSPWEQGTTLNISNMNAEKLTVYFMNAGGQTLSTAVTDTGIVPTETLVNKKGLIYYKVFDQAKNQVGSGTLLIAH